jgi:hypothetical protein
LVGIALSWCLIVGANAQPQADVATDQELFAAYCLGAIIRFRRSISPICSNSSR